MRFSLKQDRLLLFFFSCLAFTLLVLLGCLIALKHISTLQIQSEDRRYLSFRAANLLRRTSDDLTSMVRLYVSSGNTKYRDYFNEILAIRAGISPRPERYDEIYWDLVQDDVRPRPFGKPQALDQILIDQGLSLQEFEFLKQAEERSNALVLLEQKAMDAMTGEHPNPELARQLVFGDEYMRAKAAIMAPIQQFLDAIDKRTSARSDQLSHLVTLIITLAVTLSVIATLFMAISITKALRLIARGAKENELLLLNILPSAIADRLKQGAEIIADEYPQASILFADIVGFTAMTSKIGTNKMVDILGHFFDAFDELATKSGVEKIKTIGDSYMAVAGVPEPVADHAIRMANFALAMKEKIKELNLIYNLDLQMRTGMTYGAVVAGVIGHKKFIYDVWGDVVNVASRMESTGVPGEIQITEKMALLLEDTFVIAPGQEIDVKGKGMMKTFFLKGKK